MHGTPTTGEEDKTDKLKLVWAGATLETSRTRPLQHCKDVFSFLATVALLSKAQGVCQQPQLVIVYTHYACTCGLDSSRNYHTIALPHVSYTFCL